MNYPAYIDTVAPIVLRDPLADLLGTFADGDLEISYLEVVKSAGHSCPVVAGAYLMTQTALQALYEDETPVRGEIFVSFKNELSAGVTGVIASVISQITGATEVTGFKGLAGQFVRHGLMEFGADLGTAAVRFRRTDTGAQVNATYNPDSLPGDPQQQALKPRVIQGLATPEERQLFGELAQQRVADIFAHRDQVITLGA